MEGEDEKSDNPRAFTSAARWKRVIILVAGAAMNALLGMLLLVCVMLPQETVTTTQIVNIEEGSLLDTQNGLQVGDRILSIDGEDIYILNDFSVLLQLKGGETHDVEVERGGETIMLEDIVLAQTEFTNPDGTTSMRYGIVFSRVPATFGMKMQEAWNLTRYNARIVRISLQMLINGQAGITDLTGPVGMVQQISEVTSNTETFLQTLMILLEFGAMISINLAIMNLLPLPALDGGRTVCILLTGLVELITRKKINPKYEGYIHGVGMILLILLMVFILFKDIFVIFKG
jgi:regulator of sigma E protease